MLLTQKQKRLLGSQGYFINPYGTKIVWENFRGSDDDPVIKELSRKASNAYRGSNKEKFSLYDKKIKERMFSNVNKSLLKPLPTRKYLKENGF